MISALLAGWHLHRIWPVVTLLGVFSAACNGKQGSGGTSSDSLQQGTQVPESLTTVVDNGDTLPPPRAPDCPPNRPPGTKGELEACTLGLKFDTLAEAGDQQRLLVVNQVEGLPCQDNPARRCRYGPLAKIEPLKNAHKFTAADIREGRIIARLSIQGGQEGYPKLNLVPGHLTYWWVQRDSSARGGKSVYVSDSIVQDRPMTSKPQVLDARDRPPGSFKQALARWLWVPDDEKAQGSCGSASCK